MVTAADSGWIRLVAAAGTPTCSMARVDDQSPVRSGRTIRSLRMNHQAVMANEQDRAITNAQAAPSMPSGATPNQPKMSTGPTST